MDTQENEVCNFLDRLSEIKERRRNALFCFFCPHSYRLQLTLDIGSNKRQENQR